MTAADVVEAIVVALSVLLGGIAPALIADQLGGRNV